MTSVCSGASSCALWVQEEAGPARDLALRQEVDTVRQLVERHDASSKQLLHRERLATIADHVNGRPGAALSEVSSPSCAPPGWPAADVLGEC